MHVVNVWLVTAVLDQDERIVQDVQFCDHGEGTQPVPGLLHRVRPHEGAAFRPDRFHPGWRRLAEFANVVAIRIENLERGEERAVADDVITGYSLPIGDKADPVGNLADELIPQREAVHQLTVQVEYRPLPAILADVADKPATQRFHVAGEPAG